MSCPERYEPIRNAVAQLRHRGLAGNLFAVMVAALLEPPEQGPSDAGVAATTYRHSTYEGLADHAVFGYGG